MFLIVQFSNFFKIDFTKEIILNLKYKLEINNKIEIGLKFDRLSLVPKISVM